LFSKPSFIGKDEQRKVTGTEEKDTNYGSLGCGPLLTSSIFKTA
jgi:hypothetical protein